MRAKILQLFLERSIQSEKDKIYKTLRQVAHNVKPKKSMGFSDDAEHYTDKGVYYYPNEDKFTFHDDNIKYSIDQILKYIIKSDPLGKKTNGEKIEFENVILNWIINGKYPLEDSENMYNVLKKYKELANNNLKLPKKAIDYYSPGDMMNDIEKVAPDSIPGDATQYPGKIIGKHENYLLRQIDTWEEAEICFKDSGWCVQHKEYFENYKPPYFMITQKIGPKEKRIALAHEESQQIKDVKDNPISVELATEIKPLIHFIFKKEIEKPAPDKNVTLGDSRGDLMNIIGIFPEYFSKYECFSRAMFGYQFMNYVDDHKEIISKNPLSLTPELLVNNFPLYFRQLLNDTSGEVIGKKNRYEIMIVPDTIDLANLENVANILKCQVIPRELLLEKVTIPYEKTEEIKRKKLQIFQTLQNSKENIFNHIKHYLYDTYPNAKDYIPNFSIRTSDMIIAGMYRNILDKGKLEDHFRVILSDTFDMGALLDFIKQNPYYKEYSQAAKAYDSIIDPNPNPPVSYTYKDVSAFPDYNSLLNLVNDVPAYRQSIVDILKEMTKETYIKKHFLKILALCDKCLEINQKNGVIKESRIVRLFRESNPL